jgi:hypothetical protein
VRPCGEVHVADGPPRDEETREHFGEVVGRDAVAEAGVEDRALDDVGLA